MSKPKGPRWIITRDVLWEQDQKEGYDSGRPSDVGRRSMATETEEDIKACTVPFRLYDDDRNLMYVGKMSEDTFHGDGEWAFEPLDWAQYWAGCTELKYRDEKTGRWETL